VSSPSSTPEISERFYCGEKPWRSLWALYRDHLGSLALAALYYVIKGAPMWAMPVVTANVINIVSAPHPGAGRELGINALVLAILLLENIPFHWLYVRKLSIAARSVEMELRAALVRRMQELSISFYKRTSVGALQSKVLRDVESVDQTVRLVIDGGLGASLSILVAVSVTLYRAPAFLLVFVVAIPIVSGLRLFLAGALKQKNRIFRNEVEGMSSEISGMIEMIPITRAHAVEEAEIERVSRKLDLVQHAGLQLDSQNAIFQSMAWASFNSFNMASLIVGAWLSYTKIIPLRPGDIVMLSSFFGTISNSVLMIVNMMPTITKGFESVRSIGEVLECPDFEKNLGKDVVTDVRGGFDFESITFVHPGAERGSIRDFSLNVRVGETLGVIGASGAGKSTLMSLILGFDRPTTGAIRLDGRDMNEIDLRSFRRFVGVVAQDSVLFHGTLRENIVYGSRNVKDEVVLQAIKDANAAEFVSKLPDGLDTIVGERGARLSGGQKQRIAIARALIRNPRVLILDEATSALDVSSEKVVQAALDRLMEGRTTFIVAHRLSTIRNADRVIVLEDGRVVESGAPDELRAKGGRFAEMWAMQRGA